MSAVTMHRFWGLPDAQLASMQQVQFMKNVALAGASLLIVYFGPGPFSLRRRGTLERERHSPFARPLHQRMRQ